MPSDTRNIVIIGGGIIGATISYYISHHASFSAACNVTVIEASAQGPAQGASGKAGGLVARWAFPEELAALSFSEHTRLAQEHNGEERWGWRLVRCGAWRGRAEEDYTGADDGQKQERSTRSTTRRKAGLPENFYLVKKNLTDSYSSMGPPGDTAQVHPYLFTVSMLDLAKEKGASFISGSVTSIDYDDGRVSGVTYTSNSDLSTIFIPASEVILAAGPWSPSLVPALPISGSRAHSVTIRCHPTPTPSADVLFADITLPSASSKRAKTVSNEIYARPGNEVYACGPTDSCALPKHVDDVQVDVTACDSILEHVRSISDLLNEGTVERRQACYLPVSSSGSPIVGAAARIAKGLYIATGHTCWGICNAPGTAKAMSELVMEGRITCANIKDLDPEHNL